MTEGNDRTCPVCGKPVIGHRSKIYCSKRHANTAAARRYCEAHPDKVSARNRRYYEAHSEQINARTSRYYEAHSEQINARTTARIATWRKKNPEKYRKKNREDYKKKRRRQAIAHRHRQFIGIALAVLLAPEGGLHEPSDNAVQNETSGTSFSSRTAD